MGPCLVPNKAGQHCARQIEDGEPIGTVVVSGRPLVGHKVCSDEYQRRQRESKGTMVKRVDQAGPGGHIDQSTEREAVSSFSLEQGRVVPLPPSLSTLAQAAGVNSIADVPLDATPAEAYALAQEKPPAPKLSAVPRPPVGGTDLPAVSATNGQVRLDGSTWALSLEPADAEDLVNFLNSAITRAWRQQQ